MKRPSILGGVLFALAAALLSLPVFWTGLAVQGYAGATRTTLTLAHLAYCAYLLGARGGRVGAPTLAAANLLAATALWWAAWPPPATALALAGLTWLNRSLLFQRARSAVGLDAGLTLAGLLAASRLSATHTELAVALWTFFLVQSAWVLIPAHGPASRAGRTAPDPFTAGRRQAEAALEKLEGFGG